MDRKLFKSIIIILLTFICVYIFPHKAAASWHIETVDASDYCDGAYNSLALDSNYNPHISYEVGYGTDVELKYSYREVNTWTNGVVDPFGGHHSLNMSSDDKSRIVSVYVKEHGGPLYVAYAWCDNECANTSNNWTKEDVALGALPFSSLDADGYAHISYWDVTNSDLKYATNKWGNWQTSTVDSTGDVGYYSAIGLDGQGYAHISYYDAINRSLKYATNASGTWMTETVDSSVGNLLLSNPYNKTSIGIDTNGRVHISYYDEYSRTLSYITNASGTWVQETVDHIAGDWWGKGDTSLALDLNNLPHISYFDEYNSVLKYAKKCLDADDADCDDVLDSHDNCPNLYNPLQQDSLPPQGNGTGDACECEGNFNCMVDQDVDGSDASTFKLDFGRSILLRPCKSGDPCNGDFECDGDVDGTNASKFKSDFGRSSLLNPCPACGPGVWCLY